MSRDAVDVAFVEIEGQELETVRSFTVAKSDPKTVIKTMNRRRRALARSRGVPEFNVTMEVAILVDKEFDWDAWFESGDEMLMAYQKNEGGERRQLTDCTLDEISDSYEAEGENRVSLTISALDERPE